MGWGDVKGRRIGVGGKVFIDDRTMDAGTRYDGGELPRACWGVTVSLLFLLDLEMAVRCTGGYKTSGFWGI